MSRSMLLLLSPLAPATPVWCERLVWVFASAVCSPGPWADAAAGVGRVSSVNPTASASSPDGTTRRPSTKFCRAISIAAASTSLSVKPWKLLSRSWWIRSGSCLWASPMRESVSACDAASLTTPTVTVSGSGAASDTVSEGDVASG